jgi:hypothetical protein
MAASKIFINYRREDSRADAGRLYDRLHDLYPTKVFRDVGSLEPGVEWRDAINRVLADSDACMVVIGKSWLTITDTQGKRRLDDARDTVRQELQTALTSGMRVFPILVGGARMPSEEELPECLQALARRNAIELSEQDWNEDFDKLVSALERALGWSARPRRKAGSQTALLTVAGVVALCVLAVAALVFSNMLGSNMLRPKAAAPSLEKTPPPQEAASLKTVVPQPERADDAKIPGPAAAAKPPAPRDPPVAPIVKPRPVVPVAPSPSLRVADSTLGVIPGARPVEPRIEPAHLVRMQVIHRHGFNHRVARCEGWLTIEGNGTVSYECDPRFQHDNRCERVSFPPGSFTFTAADDDQLHLSTQAGNFDFFGPEQAIATAVRALGVVKARTPREKRDEPEEREEP